MDDCLAVWSAAFGDVPPLGHALRAAFPNRWVRFHALPDAQRYAADDAQRAVVLARGNALATSLMGEGAACWLIMTTWQHAGAEVIMQGLVQHWKIQGPTDDFDADEMGVYALPVIWRAGAFDGLLRAIADDESRALFAQPAIGRVFAPYDGGFDVICQTKAAREAFKAGHAGWLSARADIL